MKPIWMVLTILLLAFRENEASEREERGLVGSVGGAVGTGVGLAANGVWTLFSGIGKGLGTGFSLIGTGLKTGTSAIGSGLDMASSAIDKTSEAIGDAGHAALNGAQDLTTGITQGVSTLGDIAGKEIADAADQTVQGVKTGAGIPPPSHWWGR